MSERIRDVLVGLTMVVGTVGLAVILTLFGYVPRWTQHGYEVRVELNHAGGLAPGSRVKLSGMDVGEIRDVRLQDPPRRGVLVLAFLERHVRVPTRVQVSVEAPILGGSPTLALGTDGLGDADLGQLLPTDGTASLEGNVPSLASRFAQELQSALEEPLGRFRQLSDQWTEVARNLSALTGPRTPAEVDGGQHPANVATVLARVDARLAELKATIEGLNRWLGDEQLRADVRSTAAQAAKLTQTLDAGAERWKQLADEASGQIGRLGDRYVGVADELSGAIGTLRRLLDKAANGDGSVGRLLNDPALYNSLNDAAQRIEQALKAIQLMIEKWTAEGVPLRL